MRKCDEHIKRQNRFMPHIFGLSERNVEIARAVNKRIDAGPRHRTNPEHGPLGIIRSFKQYGIFGAKNAAQHLSDDFRSDYGNPNRTKLQTFVKRNKDRRERWRRTGLFFV